MSPKSERKAATLRSHRERNLSEPIEPQSLERIDEALHKALCMATGTDGFTLGADYAYCGAILLNRFHSNGWAMRIGEIEVVPSLPYDGGKVFAMSPKESGYSGKEYHAWCSKLNADGTSAYVDFAWRHMPRYVERSGMRWRRSEPHLPFLHFPSSSRVQDEMSNHGINIIETDGRAFSMLKPRIEASQELYWLIDGHASVLLRGGLVMHAGSLGIVRCRLGEPIVWKEISESEATP